MAFNEVRSEYLQSVGDDAFGIGFLVTLGGAAIAAIIGLGRGAESVAGALSRKKKDAATAA